MKVWTPLLTIQVKAAEQNPTIEKYAALRPLQPIANRLKTIAR